jgi:hypothetical protein
VLDLMMQVRHRRRYDIGPNMLPPAPFAYLVAEAVGGPMSASEWESVCRQLDPRALAHMRVTCVPDAWPKFMKRYSSG